MEEKTIYEVLRIIDGEPVFLEDHLERMENSFKIINEKSPFTKEKLENKIYKLIKEEDKTIGNIKITYGLSSKELKVFFIKHSYPDEEMYKNGVKTVLFFGERDNPNAKIINNEFRSRANEEIEKNNAYEAILIDRNGYITEGSRSNIFMVKGEKLLTSPVSAVLPGVTRTEIIKAAKKINIEVEEIEYSYKDIDKLDGMFISGTSPKVLPINSVGDIKLNPQNEIIKKVMDEYNFEMEEYVKDRIKNKR